MASFVLVVGPVANLALASGGIAALMIFLGVGPELLGTAVFGLYFVGLAVIYAVMIPALRELGVCRVFQALLVLFGSVFIVFLAAHLT